MEDRQEIDWHALTPAEVLEQTGTADRGLAADEAARRLREHGPNTLRAAPRPSALALFLRQFQSVLVCLLVLAAIVAGAAREWTDAAAIAAIVVANAVIGFLQERRAESALQALSRMTAPAARVRRDGQTLGIDAAAIVPGDICLLRAGELIPADLRILRDSALRTNEASLTGESLPIDKTADPCPKDTVPAERRSMLYAGTNVVNGTAEGIVVAVGMRTEIGKIADLVIRAPAPEKTPLEARIAAFGGKLSWAALAICALVFGLGRWRGVPWIEILLTSISLAVAAVPEGLPAVVTIALAVGVQKMAARQAIVRRLAAVETLGSTNVIATDKTGTLTMGEMTARAAWTPATEGRFTGDGYAPEGTFTGMDGAPRAIDASMHDLLSAMVLVNGAALTRTASGWTVLGDPTEGALLVAAAKAGIDRAALEADRPLERLHPFDSTRKRMSAIRRAKDGARTVYVKGAPEAVLELSTTIRTADGVRPMTAADRAAILDRNAQFAGHAWRVLGAAVKTIDSTAPLPAAEAAEADLTFLGLVGMQDPPRPDAKEAIETCRRAGIRVVMITGDQSATARAVATELRILTDDRLVMEGRELDGLDEETLTQRAPSIAVYARTTAAHKLRIVNAWKKNGAVVAMTGDGVNDAPALRGADIGVAMGRKGTEVAREASAMVIADDRFATIVHAVTEGRGIYDNIKKTMQYLLAGNVGELIVMGTAVLIGVPMPLLPIHLLWINLVTDGLPALCLAVDPIDPHVMRRVPRARTEQLADRAFLARMIVTGVLTASVALGTFLWSLPREGLALARAHAFGVLVIAELLRSFGCRSERPLIFGAPRGNARLTIVVLLSLAFQVFIHVTGACESWLKTPPMSFGHTLVLFAFGTVPLIVMELIKIATPRRG